MRINTLLNEDGPISTSASKGPGRGNWSRNRTSGAARAFKSKLDAAASQDGQSPSTSGPTFNGPHGFYLPLNGSDPSHKRTRPLTQHQLAVEQYRRRRVDVILDRGIRVEYQAAAKRRRQANTFTQSWIRCKGMPDGYDTDEETHALFFSNSDDVGTKTPPPMPAGLAPLDFGGEVNDHGEESYFRAKMLSRALRRLQRWEDGKRIPRNRPKDERAKRAAAASHARPVPMDDDDDEDDEDMLDPEDRREDSDSDDEMEDLENVHTRARDGGDGGSGDRSWETERVNVS